MILSWDSGKFSVQITYGPKSEGVRGSEGGGGRLMKCEDIENFRDQCRDGWFPNEEQGTCRPRILGVNDGVAGIQIEQYLEN